MTIQKLKLAWKYRRLIWKYRKLYQHRKDLAALLVAGVALGSAIRSKKVSAA